MRKVLTKLSGRKAKGPDGRGPKELLTLPTAWTDQLANFYNDCEHNGTWPQALLTCVIALIPNPGATTEAQLRPIGIMPYIYRTWVAARRSQARQWSLHIHGGAHLGAAAMVIPHTHNHGNRPLAGTTQDPGSARV